MSVSADTSQCEEDHVCEEYTEMLFDIGMDISEQNLTKLLFLCRNDITKKDQEHIKKNSLELFDILQNKGLISQKKNDYLTKKLAKIGRKDLAEELNKYDICLSQRMGTNYNTEQPPIENTMKSTTTTALQVSSLSSSSSADDGSSSITPVKQPFQTNPENTPRNVALSHVPVGSLDMKLSATPHRTLVKQIVSPLDRQRNVLALESMTPLSTTNIKQQQNQHSTAMALSSSSPMSITHPKQLHVSDTACVPLTIKTVSASMSVLKRENENDTQMEVDSAPDVSNTGIDTLLEEDGPIDDDTQSVGKREIIGTRSQSSSLLENTTGPNNDYLGAGSFDGAAVSQRDILVQSNVISAPGNEVIQPCQITMRNYQLEVAKPAIEKHNSIICLPTGSGKTLTSAHVCKILQEEAMKEGRRFKALFIVCIRNLVKQQSDDYKSLFPKDNVIGWMDDTVSLSDKIQVNDVIMLTAQILVNALNKEEVHLSDFDLFVMDECHHANLGHPYNVIMRKYMKEKKEGNTNLPQILGLTASLGSGGSHQEKKAIEHYIRVCANLDCYNVAHVRDEENMKELLRINPKPSIDQILSVEGRSLDDPFYVTICTFMSTVEQWIGHAVIKDVRGSQQYENWVIGEMKMAERTDSIEGRSCSVACRFLNCCNLCIVIYCNFRAKDALSYLEEVVAEEFSGHRNAIEMERKCVQLFKDKKDELNRYSDKEKLHDNKMLANLYKLVRLLIKRNQDSGEPARGIILIRTRAGTKAMESCIKEEKLLKGLAFPGRLVGQGKDKEDAVTSKQQMDALDRFRRGPPVGANANSDGINVLIATDVAQEGLDITTCNFVIRYNFVSNEIGAVQSKGRARAKESECYLIVPKGSTNERREFDNLCKEHAMMEALKGIDQFDESDLSHQIVTKQDELWTSYLEEIKLKNEMAQASPAAMYDIVCKNCKTFLSKGTDVVKKGSAYICVDPLFTERIDRRVYTRKKDFRDDIHIGRTICKEASCQKELGVHMQYKKGGRMNGYSLGCQSIMFKARNTQSYMDYKKWSKVPFNASIPEEK